MNKAWLNNIWILKCVTMLSFYESKWDKFYKYLNFVEFVSGQTSFCHLFMTRRVPRAFGRETVVIQTSNLQNNF